MDTLLVEPEHVRQPFNDTDADQLWLVVGAPPEPANTLEMTPEQLAELYPDGPKAMPPELALALLRRLLRLRGLHPLRLALLLGEVRRPRRVAQAPLLVAAGQVEELVERAGVLVDVGRRVAELRDAVRDRVEAQVAGLDVGDLVPV